MTPSSAPLHLTPANPVTHGLFDFQVNGFAGVDFQSEHINAQQLRHAVDALVREGVTCIFIALITDSEDRLARQFERLERLRQADPLVASVVCGYHLEGPWLSPLPGYCGAHEREFMTAPTVAAFDMLQRASGGNIRLVTLAPEWPGSPEVIAYITATGVRVSLGHTAASEAEIDAAIAAGARFCTHLGNGVPLQLPRHDNVIQRLLARDELTACFIPDGLHLPPFVLRNMVRAKPPGRVLFTTDAMAGAGAPPGRYSIGGRLEVDVGADSIARGPNGGFAGSTLTPSRAVTLTARFIDVEPAEARRLWSTASTEAFLGPKNF